MESIKILLFVIIISLLIFIDGLSQILYLIMKFKIDIIMYSFFRFSIITLLLILMVKIFPDFFLFAIGFMIYLFFSRVIWRYVLKRWAMNYEKRRMAKDVKN